MKRFNKNEKRDKTIIIGLVLVIGIIVGAYLYKSHAYFETSKTYNVIEGKIPNFTKGDITLAVIVDGKEDKSRVFPDKQNHKYIETKCNNEIDINFNPDTWKLSLSNIDRATICTIEFEEKTNLDLDGSEPVIKYGLVPVVIADNGDVTKTTKDNLNWYNYDEAKWANAVILTGIDNYQVGDTIPEEAIESYFVWIPKYRYKLFNVEGNQIDPREIDIQIGDYDTVDDNTTECKATNKSGDNGTCKNDMWMTHPAFTSLGVNGIWVGKFETTESKDEITVKPNMPVIKNLNLSTIYNTAFNYKRNAAEPNKNLDSHMMKNTEWGAMAYLTNSKYGRGNSIVPIEDSADYTGYDGGSTTDNKSGIYGTSGGVDEYVMGVLNNSIGASGFLQETLQNLNTRYIDRYVGEENNINSKILGDATGETFTWWSDINYFVSGRYPWFSRGGSPTFGSHGGIFRCYIADGIYTFGFRLVLSPTN